MVKLKRYPFLAFSFMITFFLSAFSQDDTGVINIININSIFSQKWDSMEVVWSVPVNTNLPVSARALGMADVGVATTNDNMALAFNPAGLGIFNDRWEKGAFTLFFKPLYPFIDIPDQWNLFATACYQPKSLYIGGFSIGYHRINLGENFIYNESGVMSSSYIDGTNEFSVAWGYNLNKIGFENHSLGITLKFVDAPYHFEYYNKDTYGLLFNIGYIGEFFNCLRFGLHLENIGKKLSGIRQYIEQRKSNNSRITKRLIALDDDDYLTPFTISSAIGFLKSLSTNELHVIDFLLECKGKKEFNKNYEDNLDNISVRIGSEFNLFKTAQPRLGFAIDNKGDEFQFHTGIGISFLNHFQFDSFLIFSPTEETYRNRQWGFSFSFFRIFTWSKNDLMWWYKSL